ncbi:MAG: hypothetical protein M3Q44_00290 [bacterium]|nr:hypothetical protein [bacterium]
MLLTRRRNVFLLFFLTLLGIITYYLYSAILPLFFEGDDFVVLWHIRVPVNFILKPFVGWDIPIAGRYSYGQAWYESALYSFWGLNPYPYNLSGILIRIVTIVSLFFCTWKMTRNITIAMLASLLFTVLSTGIESTYYVFHHMHFIFISLVLVGLSSLFSYFETGLRRNWVWAFIYLFVASYLYTIRVAGLILIPIWSAIRIAAVSHPQLRKKYIAIGLITMVLLFVLITFAVKDVAYVSTKIRTNLIMILVSKNDEFISHFQPFIVSVGRLIYPLSLLDLITLQSYRSVLLLGLAFSAGIVAYELLDRYLGRYSQKPPVLITISKILVLLCGTVWVGLFAYLEMIDYSYFFNLSHMIVASLGFFTVLTLLYIGLCEFRRFQYIASTLLICATAMVMFYVPNWLFMPMSYSNTESRYFSSSSVFLVIAMSCCFYLITHSLISLLHSPINAYFKPFVAAVGVICVTGIISYYYFHYIQLKTAIADQTEFRDTDKILRNWKVVAEKVAFEKPPTIIFLWTRTDIVRVMKMFFDKETFGLVGNLPFGHELPQYAESMTEAANFICEYEESGKKFDPNQFYEFELDKNDIIIPRIEDGRKRLETWKDYCLDPLKKGAELQL